MSALDVNGVLGEKRALENADDDGERLGGGNALADDGFHASEDNASQDIAVISSEDSDEESAADLDFSHYRLRKRLVVRKPSKYNDLYITRSTRFPALLARCEKLLERQNTQEVHIHALGAAIQRACELANKLVARSHNTLALNPSTSTVITIDDYEPISIVRRPPLTSSF
mmetsp:Transcript_2128/g.4743  ORF Transcript_2128/g.4743 Transcript_2128/m.4743 type:complete len:171 (+) Transcript_2128:2235-2747(+)